MDEGFSDDDVYYNIAASFMLNEDKGGVKGKCTLSYHSMFLLVALMPLIVAAIAALSVLPIFSFNSFASVQQQKRFYGQKIWKKKKKKKTFDMYNLGTKSNILTIKCI